MVLSKVRGDINPADVLTKPKSLEDMRLLLNFSCLDWCDGRVPDSHYCGDRIEYVNSVGNRSIFKDDRIEFVNSVVGENTCRDNRSECLNCVGASSFEDAGRAGRYYFLNNPTVRRRGGCWSSNSLFRTQPPMFRCL